MKDASRLWSSTRAAGVLAVGLGEAIAGVLVGTGEGLGPDALAMGSQAAIPAASSATAHRMGAR